MQTNCWREDYLVLGMILYYDKTGTDVYQEQIAAHVIYLPFLIENVKTNLSLWMFEDVYLIWK